MTKNCLALRGLLLTLAGATLAYLGHLATDGNTLGTYGPVVAAASAILTDVLRSYAAKKTPDAPESTEEE